MKLLNRTLVLATSLLTLHGCVVLKPALETAVPPVMITESLPQICQTAKNNAVTANDVYKNKGLSINGKVSSINEGFQPQYRVLISSGKVAVHAGTDNKVMAKQLSVGQAVRVSGVVTDVSYDYSGCSISLKDATF